MLFEKPDWKIEAERRGESLPDWYTIREAAEIIEVHESYLSQLARADKIVTYKVGKYRFMDAQQIQILLDKK